MYTVTIPQKQSNSGSIHDIASEHFDREIKFRLGTCYAVVLSSYYGGKGYTTHKTTESAIAKSKKTEESHKLIDFRGNLLDHNGHDAVYFKCLNRYKSQLP